MQDCPTWKVEQLARHVLICFHCGDKRYEKHDCEKHKVCLEDAEKDQRKQEEAAERKAKSMTSTKTAVTKCVHCGFEGHSAGTCPNLAFEKVLKAERQMPICFHCGERGHVKQDCPTWKADQLAQHVVKHDCEKYKVWLEDAEKDGQRKQEEVAERKAETDDWLASQLCRQCGEAGYMKANCPVKPGKDNDALSEVSSASTSVTVFPPAGLDFPFAGLPFAGFPLLDTIDIRLPFCWPPKLIASRSAIKAKL